MSIRFTALIIVVTGLCIYAWKDWFKSLCGLILIMAVIEHESMPKSILGIQGFNLWNVLFLVIFLSWLAERQREGLTWDMPRHVRVLLLLYLGVILVGFLRAVFDRSNIQDYPLKSLISEELINTVKWVLPGVLLFDGCRTRRRLVMALVCLLAMYFLIAVQVIKLMPSNAIYSHLTLENSRREIGDSGYNACNVSAMLAGAFWGILAVVPLVHRKKYWIMVLAVAGVFAYGQAITGGRAGYIAWGATGLVLCIVKWRKQLILAPLVVMLLPIVFPAAADRILVGFGQTDVGGQTTTDDSEMTSGRTLMWPYVIDKICESPIVGYGRKAMQRTGLSEYVGIELSDDAWGHPHNMYLETLLDNGILGSIPIFLFWGMVLKYSARLFRSNNRLCSAIGGLTLSLVLTQLFTGIGSQHFYPKEETFGMWMGMFLAIRVYVEEKQIQSGVINAENSWNSQAFRQQVAIV
ncbi:MAG: O-antigen ligase family protein [Deltaproteobacteria bacterium]|nr:O-antigen ligase family protein [Deltaproteobacteria bacterium]